MLNSNLGKKIKYFRVRAGLSQLDLELAIHAAQGSISRIESGKVNPTKETINHIAKILMISDQERIYLLDLEVIGDDERENMEVLKLVEDDFKKISYMAYLLDRRSCMLAVSRGIKVIGKISGVDTDKFLGKHVTEIVFDYELGLRSLIAKDKFDDVAVFLLSVLVIERGYLLTDPWWQELWEKTNRSPVNTTQIKQRQVSLSKGHRKLDFVLSFNNFHHYPGYTLAEMYKV
jgi:transcriptional regulator with XRE-family HTH domain